jgi:hypothetical protein
LHDGSLTTCRLLKSETMEADRIEQFKSGLASMQLKKPGRAGLKTRQ